MDTGSTSTYLLLLSGSFHSRSKSLAICRLIKKSLASCCCELPRIDQLPFYSEDLNRERPPKVASFLEQVAQCDGIVFVTPEYNHSIPAVLKNAIDWASRPAFASPLKGKPVTIVTQSGSAVGGARAQAHLKLVLDSTLSRVHSFHEMLIGEADKFFTSDALVLDPVIQGRLLRHMGDFLEFIAEGQ